MISFSVLEAKNEILEEGIVYTFRWKRRSFFAKEKGSMEHTWATDKRGGKKLFDVTIEEVGEINPFPTVLEKYTPQSGFGGPWLWYDQILQMQPPVFQITGWLYKVSRTSKELRKDKNE